MVVRSLSRPRGSVVRVLNKPLLSDVTRWRNAVVANGGTVSDARAAIVATFIAAEKASGAWALTDDYWAFWAENEIQALTSLKQRRLAVAATTLVVLPAFTIDRGYVFDGLVSYIASGFIPATHAVAMGINSARLGVYERTNVVANTSAAGCASSASILLRMRPRNATGTALSEPGCSGAGGALFTLPSADSRGFTAGSRGGAAAANCLGYKNGAAMTRTVDPTTFAASLPTHELYIGANNNIGTPANFRANSMGFVVAGGALSAGQELAQYNAIQAWATSVGAQV